MGLTAAEIQRHKGVTFTDDYSAVVDYSVMNAAGDELTFTLKSRDFERSLEYKAQGGDYFRRYQANTEWETDPMDTDKFELDGFRWSAPLDVLSMLYDPRSANTDNRPESVEVTNTFSFPLATTRTRVYKQTIPLNFSWEPQTATLPLEVTGDNMIEDYKDCKATINFEEFGGYEYNGVKMPVHTYIVSAYASTEAVANDRIPTLPYKPIMVRENDNDFLLSDSGHSYWWGSDKSEAKSLDYTYSHDKYVVAGFQDADIAATWEGKAVAASKLYVYYKVDAVYNFAFLQNGVFDAALLHQDLTSSNGQRIFWTLQTPPDPAANGIATLADVTPESDYPTVRTVSLPSLASSETDTSFSYQISPSTVTGFAHAEYNVQPGVITGIDDIEADDSDATPEYFTLQGLQVSDPQPGQVYIVRRGASVTKQLMK